jgi:hypothetical protein
VRELLELLRGKAGAAAGAAVEQQQQLNFLNANDTDEEHAFQAKAPENSIKINLCSCQRFGGQHCCKQNYAAIIWKNC